MTSFGCQKAALVIISRWRALS